MTSKYVMTVPNNTECKQALISLGVELDMYNNENPYICIRIHKRPIWTTPTCKHAMYARNIGRIQGKLGTVEDIYAIGLLPDELKPTYLGSM